VQALHADVERWMAKTHKVCGTVPTPIATDEADETSADAAGARSAKRRKLAAGQQEESDVVFNETELVEEPQVTAVHAASAKAVTAAKSGPMSPLAQLDGLIAEGKQFRLDLSEQVQLLAHVKAHAEGWERSAVQYISTQFSDSLKKVFIEYKRLITDYTAPENGAIFPFLQRKPSAQSSHSIAKGYKEEAMVHQKLQALLTEVLAVRTVGERIGVEMPFHRAILVYIRLLEWVQETRNVACFLNSSRRPASSSAAGQKKGAALESFGGWEDLKDLATSKNWGDVNADFVLALIAEGSAMQSLLYNLEGDEKLPGLLVHYAKGVLGSAAEYHDLVEEEEEEEEEEPADEDNEAGADGDAMETEDRDHQDGGGNESGHEEDGDQEGDETEGGASAARKRPSSDSRKRKSAPVESSPQASKSTRAASGITKKKIDTDFADTVNLQHLNSASNGASKPANKRQKTGAASSRATASVKSEEAAVEQAVVVEAPKPVVDLDLAKTARRAAVAAFFESTDAKAAKLSPAMAHMLDMWTRVLKVFALRLRVAGAWALEAQRLVGGLRITDGATSLESDGGAVGSVKAGSEEEIERLIATAQEASIQVYQRYHAFYEILTNIHSMMTNDGCNFIQNCA